MPFLTTESSKIYYRLEGKPGPLVLVLSHSIGTDHGMWEPQIGDWIQHFQVLRYDTRGHGASDAPAGEYSVEQLGNDVLALADALGLGKFAFCGLSMGGAIGQWLAANAPDRIKHLILANTGPRLGSPENWEMRIRAVTEKGMGAIADLAMQRFFSSEALQRNDPSTRVDQVGVSGDESCGICRLLCGAAGFRRARAARPNLRPHARDRRTARRVYPLGR